MTSEARDAIERPWKELGVLVRAGRKALPQMPTQMQLAARWGKAHTTLSRIETGTLRSHEQGTFASLYPLIEPGLSPAQRKRFKQVADTLGLNITQSPQAPATPFIPDAYSGWQELFAAGCRLGNQAAWEAAIPLLQLAQGAATLKEERAEALTVEAGGRLHLAEVQYDLALRTCFAALNALDLDTTPPSPKALPLRALSARGARVYGRVAHNLGQVYYRRHEYELADRWLHVAKQLGLELSWDGLQREALHFLMRCRFDQATLPGLPLYGGWWRVRVAEDLHRALRYLADAQQLEPLYRNSLGHDLRWMARVLFLLSEPERAHRALQDAAVNFGSHPAIGHVRLDEGWLALADDQYLRAKEKLHEALGYGWSMRHAKLVADAAFALADLATLTSRQRDYRQALRFAIAALLAYPPYLDSPHGHRAVTFCVDVIECMADAPRKLWQRERQHISEEIFIGKAPFHYLRGLHTSDPLQPESIERVLGAIDVWG